MKKQPKFRRQEWFRYITDYLEQDGENQRVYNLNKD